MKAMIALLLSFYSTMALANDKLCTDAFEAEGMSYEMIHGMIPQYRTATAAETSDFVQFMAFQKNGVLGVNSLEKNATKAVTNFETCLNATKKEYVLFSFYTAVSNSLFLYECAYGTHACDSGNVKVARAAMIEVVNNTNSKATELKNTIGTWATATYSKACPTGPRTKKLCTILDLSIQKNGGLEDKENLGKLILQTLASGF